MKDEANKDVGVESKGTNAPLNGEKGGETKEGS